jgi:hypothetical protein
MHIVDGLIQVENWAWIYCLIFHHNSFSMMFSLGGVQCTQIPIVNNLQMVDHGDDMILLGLKNDNAISHFV